MWWTWYRSTEYTATRLITGRDALVKVLANVGENEVFDIPDIDPFRGFGSGNSFRTDYGFWMNCSLHAKFDTSRNGLTKAVWTADWPTIEAKAAEEKWTIYRQIVFTTMVAFFLIWGSCRRLTGGRAKRACEQSSDECARVPETNRATVK